MVRPPGSTFLSTETHHTMSNAPSKASDLLKNLGKKTVPTASPMAAQVNDPAIAGAKRDKNTVILGFDPNIAKDAALAARLDETLKRAESEFKVEQATMRDYGASKRGLYNDTYRCEVTTVKVPYSVDTPTGPETRYVAVVCTNKYSVQQDMILGNRDLLGSAYEKLFEETTVKSLKPNAEDLIRGVFTEVGLEGDELEAAMGQLFEEKTTVKTTEHFESEAKKLPEAARAILDQAVTRSQPALKFG